MLDNTGGMRFADADATSRVDPASAHVRRVAAFRDPRDAFAAWDALEATAAMSPYQTRRWLMPWLETTGRATGVAPLIVVAFDSTDQPIALLPFGTWRQGMLGVGGFLGGRDSNFNMGLFKPGVTWTAGKLIKLLRGTVRNHVDVLVFRNQPHQWEGVPNPFLLLPHQPSPSFGYKVALFRDPDEFVRRNLSGDNRKKLRKKAARLSAMAPLRHEEAKSAEVGRAILDAFVDQRLSRCMALGISAADLPDLRAFLERASIVGMQQPTVELHGLYCGDRIVATFGGTSHRDRFCGMVMSFDADPEISRSSPGEILLERLIRAKCSAGVALFDLGIGEARYKEAYCPEPDPLFDSVVTVSHRGAILAAAEKLRLRVKREIKQSDRAWAVIRSARRIVSGFRPPHRPPL